MRGWVQNRCVVCLVAAWVLMANAVRGSVFISELLAQNENGIRDEDGERCDWLELYNSGDEAVSLEGWWLTDKSSEPTQWRLPAVSIAAKGVLFLWASGKDRASVGSPLHTSFALSKSGEYLGLYRPDETTGQPVLVDAYAPAFPALPPDVSYGHMFGQSNTAFVVSGEVGRYRVPSSALVYTGTVYSAGQMGYAQPGGWNVSTDFDDSGWTLGATGIGYDTTGGFAPWIGTSPSGVCSNVLYKINTSLCFRRTFLVPSLTNLSSVTLRMKYEDGFVAYVNGIEVGRANCTNVMAYNTKANTYVNEAILNSWTDYTVSNAWLVAGTNLLAIQGLNSATTSSDFLLLPELWGLSTEDTATRVYFDTPTPGELNGTGTAGPLLYGATPADPDVPRPLGTVASPPLTVTVKVLKTRFAVSAVRAVYGPMWSAEANTVALRDDGVAPDAQAGDGVYSAQLPTTSVLAGQMFRWRFEATDVSNTVTYLPAYTDPLDTPRYFGTVAADATTASSSLPVLEWFVQGSPTNGPTAAAFRGSCYYLSNFYDNVGHEIHGQSTASFTKKSYDFDFSAEDRFLWKEGERRVKDLNLLSNYADKTKARNTFAHWVGKQSGTPYHYAFPVRVHLNGVFHGVLDMLENGGDRMLERNGLDPEGAFYKIYNTVFTLSPEKKTRKDEDNSDLQALYDGLDTALSLSNRQAFAYDNLDVAATVNYLVTRFINSDSDHGHKNYYLYRDTNVTREWQPVIWDVDLSQGHVWNSAENYFDDDLITNILFTAGSGSRVYNVVYSSPEMKQMFVRRMRTLMDTLLQPPGTVDGIFETRLREIAAQVDPDPADPSPWTDGDLDAARWGIDARFSQHRPREEVERVIADYFAPRRAFMFNQGSGRPTYSGVALPDAAQTNVSGMVVFDGLDYLPVEGSQSNEYVILRNATSQAVDISGWRVEGEIEHTFKGGTVIPAGAGTAATNYIGLLHLVKDAVSFRKRAVGPTGGERRFVQGNYSGQLSARGGTLRLYDDADLLIATCTYAGSPLPSQKSLRITEIQYHPADPTAAEAEAIVGVTEDDFEYLELSNIGSTALALSGAYFSRGIAYTFPDYALTVGERVVLAKNPEAFRLRYPAVTVALFGPYEDVLDNGGERLELKDACGETVLDFEYKDGWYAATDGTGRSLVLRDASVDYSAFSDAVSWGISGESEGSPGCADVSLAQSYYGWDAFHFTSEEIEDEEISGPYDDPDGDGRVNWLEYALGCDPRVPDKASVGLCFVEADAQRHAALVFSRVPHALDVSYSIWATSDLRWELWQPVAWSLHQTEPYSDNRETVILREDAAATPRQRFYQLRLTFE